MQKRKIAIFHNFIDNPGGGEIVAFTLAKDLHADLYTTNFNTEKIKKAGFSDVNIISIGKVPINPPFKHQLALRKFSKLNLKNKYDGYIIAGDWAVSGGMHNKPVIWYIHSPMRELWDLYEYTRKTLVPWYKRPFFDLWVKYNQKLSRKYIGQIKNLVCNSITTQKRIKKYFNREATVIHPPIETSKFRYKKNGNFWLSVNRLINYKRVELQIEAFRKLPEERLIIVGSHEKADHFVSYANHLNRIKPKNVEILEWIDIEKLTDLYANCKGFITTSKEEDFGMTVIEAMASGKPVIAPNEGGYKESVIDKKTGILIDEINEQKIIDAIKKLGKNPAKYKNACIKQAKKFDKKIFIKKINKEIDKIISK